MAVLGDKLNCSDYMRKQKWLVGHGHNCFFEFIVGNSPKRESGVRSEKVGLGDGGSKGHPIVIFFKQTAHTFKEDRWIEIVILKGGWLTFRKNKHSETLPVVVQQ